MASADPLTDPPDDEESGPQIGTGPSVALLALAWPLVQMASADDGLLVAAGVGLGGVALLAICAAFLAGVLESVVGRKRCASTAFAASCALAALYWWRSLPWWAAATLSAVSIAGWLSLWRREAALEGLVEPLDGLPEAVRLQVEASRHLHGAHAEARDRVVALYRKVQRAARELADDPLVDARRLQRDAEATVIVTLRRLRRLADLGGSSQPAGQEEQARVDASCRLLEDTYDHLVAYLGVRDDGHTPDLSEHAEQLKYAARSLSELGDL